MPLTIKPDSGIPGGFYQNDFGGFNPRFAGVTIRIASQAAYDEFLSFLRSPTHGGLPGDKEESLGPILIRSVMEHEIRHYHDFLLGSYNGMLFRNRLQAVLNGIKALRAVKELPGNVFPVPLNGWMMLSAEERESQLEEWAAFGVNGEKPSVIPVPIISKEALLAPREPGIHAIDDDPAAVFALAAGNAAHGYANIQAFAQGVEDSAPLEYRHLITPANIQEVLALTVQLGAIWQAQGEQQARIFARFFLGQSHSPFARLWQFLLDLSLRGMPDITGREGELEKAFAASFKVMTIGTWTLLGSHSKEGGSVSPAKRLINLLKLLLADSAEADTPGNTALGVAATWDCWDKALGLNPWRESLNELLDWANRGVGFYGQLHEMSEPGWEKDFHAILHNMMKAYADDQRMLIGHVLEQPEDLVGVTRYLGLGAGTLPMPLFRLQMDNEAALDLSTLDQKIFEPVMTADFEGGVAVLSYLLKTSPPTYHQRAGDAIAFEYAAQLCDMAFSQQESYGRAPLLKKRLSSDLERTVGKTLRAIV